MNPQQVTTSRGLEHEIPIGNKSPMRKGEQHERWEKKTERENEKKK